MDREKINALITTEKGSWMQDAKRRKRWRWLNRLTLKPRIKYYRLKRKFFTLFMYFVIVPKGTVCPACKVRRKRDGWNYCRKCMGNLDII